MKFDQIYVVSLKKRKNRLDSFFQNLPDNWNLGDITVFDAIDGESCIIPDYWKSGKGAWGCYQSHLEIIKQSYNNNNILIFEDDAIFCDNFIEKYTHFMNNLPKNWEMLYLGGQHLKMPQQKIINDTVGIGTNINRTHAYGLNNDGIKKIYAWLQEDFSPKHHIDHHYGKLHESGLIIPYCPLQWLVGQNNGYSDIRNKTCKLRWWN